MEKQSVISLVLLRIEKFKSDISNDIDFLFDNETNPVRRSAIICELISDLDVGLKEILEGKKV